MNKATSILACATIAFAGCSNVKSDAVTTSNKDQVLTDVAKSGLTDDEKQTFLNATMRNALGDYSLTGKTVSQIIDEQMKFKAEQDAEAEAAHAAQIKAEAAKAVLLSEMHRMILVQPISKRFHEHDFENSDFDDIQYVTFQFHNTGIKAISGIKGGMTFRNSFGDKVIELNLEEGGNGNASLRPGKTSSDEIAWKYNQFEDQWKTFRFTELSSMRAEWTPEQIIFADGTSVKAPDDK